MGASFRATFGKLAVGAMGVGCQSGSVAATYAAWLESDSGALAAGDLRAGEKSADYHLLRPGAAAEIASHARDTLLRWQVDMTDRGLRQSFQLDQDCGTFLQWLALFERRLNATDTARRLIV